MCCKEVRGWTFQGLVAAFVDLSVAFLLLCASSLVYLSSNFLGLFGLNLPCPCDGLFSDSRKNKCFQETLRNLPVEKISSVQNVVKNRTPFDSVLCKEANDDFVEKKRKGEREVSVTPCDVEVVEKASGFDLLTSQSNKKGSFKVRSKRLSFHRSSPPCGLKNRYQGGLKFPKSPASVMEYCNDLDSLLLNSKDGGNTLEDMSLRKSISLSSIGCEVGSQNKQPERTCSWAGEGTYSSPVDLTQKTIDILEQVIAEERSARAALALELEKERNAAASAADEALSMILRLQEEKASIEMEARQYQRMIEEKSAFDAEEMTILKEILLRREKEKHFLEKEVDTYRQMFVETEQTVLNTPDSKQAQQMSEPLDYMETMDVSSGFEIFANQTDSHFLAVGNKSMLSEDYNYPEHHLERDEELQIDVKSEERSINISDSKNLGEDAHDIDCHVHDIHVVADEDNKMPPNIRDFKLDRSKSVSGTSYGLPLPPPAAYPSGQRNMSPNMRRNSMSAIDYERLKIESEVGLLRGRLRAVQKGREKISFSSKEQSLHRHGDKTSRFWEARRSGERLLDSSSPSSSTMVKATSMTFDLHSA